MTTVRGALYDLLVEGVATVKGEVWEPSAAGPKMEKPCLVLREGPQTETEKYADFSIDFEVWPYVKRTTFQDVDNLAKEVKKVIDKKRFDVAGKPFYIEFVGSTEDIVDEEWDALTRGLSFKVHSLSWLVHEPVEPDPVTTMTAYSSMKFIDLQTNPATWKPSDERPALYWRQEAITATDPTAWGAWITATLKGHVINPDVAKRKKVSEMVARQLLLDNRAYMSDKSPMNFENVSVNDGYDPFKQGQIHLSVRYGILKERPRNPLRHVYTNDSDKAKGAVHK
ncbi:hypothetical protein ACQKMV_05240 [Lysinibacillus sp. NPDC094403]|uniref:hypothetical protein n=1 Tax=Lysinibacillus sp. NPDC094403 TaxID=3390581 RepID=UPI003D0916D1